MTMLRDFFLFCSGVNRSLLNRAPIDTTKYVGMGATIFFTGVFAALAGGYAAYTTFHSYLIAVPMAIFWGFMIFNLDRYIVSTMRNKDSFLANFLSASPRVVLALLIAIVIAKPLELKIFESEIESELVLIEQEKYKEQDQLVTSRYIDQIDTLKSEINQWKGEIDDKSKERDALVAIAIAEADGTGGSMQKNLGPIYKTKKTAADRAQKELDEVVLNNTELINAHQKQIDTKTEEMNSTLAALKRVALNGFAARLEGLERATAKSSAIKIASIFIMLLFMAIELAPIITKLIMEKGPYDLMLEEHELKYAQRHNLHYSKANSAMSLQKEFDRVTQDYKLKNAIKAEKEIADLALKERIEKLKKDPFLWNEYLNKGKILDV